MPQKYHFLRQRTKTKNSGNGHKIKRIFYFSTENIYKKSVRLLCFIILPTPPDAENASCVPFLPKKTIEYVHTYVRLVPKNRRAIVAVKYYRPTGATGRHNNRLQ